LKDIFVVITQYILFVFSTFLWNFINVSGSRSKLSNSASYVFVASGAVSIAYVLSIALTANLLVEAHAAHRWDQFGIAVLLYGLSGASGNLAGWCWARGWETRHNVERG